MVIQRRDGRRNDQLRPVNTTYNVYEFAAGSVLFEFGKTKVLCAITVQNGVPAFLKGKGAGWLTAEYALLPASTNVRTQRESSLARKDGRSVEISRFIGRCFRSVVDLSAIGERTITIDCDVLQADGGTRTAAITGSFLALLKAQEVWFSSKLIHFPVIRDSIAAVSVGIVHGQPILDLDCQEDQLASADFNFVITQSDSIIEMQGGAECNPVTWEQFELIRDLARQGASELFALHGKPKNALIEPMQELKRNSEPAQHTPFFSLKSRHQSS